MKADPKSAIAEKLFGLMEGNPEDNKTLLKETWEIQKAVGGIMSKK